MSEHAARFPGIVNDPDKHVVTRSEAARLAALSRLPAAEFAGRPLAGLVGRLRDLLAPDLLLFRRLCGRVVKTDAAGQELPVPFATVKVFDTDLRLLAWSPLGSLYSWFWPFVFQRELLATVTTDECGRFCVRVPRFDLDWYLRFRLERRCYLTWLRRPSVADLLRERGVLPRLEPVPVRPLIDEHLLTHAARVLDASALARLRRLTDANRIGALQAPTDAALSRPAFPNGLRAPLPPEAIKDLSSGVVARMATRAGITAEALQRLDAQRALGPFLRCRDVPVPRWLAIRDVPDLTFEVTQDVDGDGDQEVIYSEGFFDVRWDAGALGDVTLQASAIAVASPSCNVPDIGVCGTPAILFASNYPLQVQGVASDFHDAGAGYALLPNRPDENGIPGEGARLEPAQAPFVGAFHLVGCAERPGATHYRVLHQIDGGPVTYLNRSFGPLTKLVGGVLQLRVVSVVDGQWYPIVARSEGFTPVGLLAPFEAAKDHRHTFRLEFGAAAGGVITPIAGSQTTPVSLRVDATEPSIEDLALSWRHPGGPWQALPVDDADQCLVVTRTSAALAVQFRLSFTVSARHLRSFSAGASGCGGSAPQLVTDGHDGLPLPAADAAAHWHTGPSDNAAARTLFYELSGGAPAGCYHFTVAAVSRAFQPTQAIAGDDPVQAWRIDDAAVLIERRLSVAVQ